ncbi:MAG: hypothetical protein AB1420_18825 [Bacillota bacterium]
MMSRVLQLALALALDRTRQTAKLYPGLVGVDPKTKTMRNLD